MALTKAQIQELLDEISQRDDTRRTRLNAIPAEIETLQAEMRALTAKLDDFGNLRRALEALRDTRA